MREQIHFVQGVHRVHHEKAASNYCVWWPVSIVDMFFGGRQLVGVDQRRIQADDLDL